MCNKYTIWEDGEYQYAGAFGFTPSIHAYIHEDDAIRPAIIIVPGGGYSVASPTEGGIVAERFYDAGFQSFVLTYTTNLIRIAPLGLLPAQDLSRAVRYIRAHHDTFRVSDKLFVCGFSAGAHLAGTLAVHWQELEDRKPEWRHISNRPTGALLCYPVITTDDATHRGSIDALCGENASKEELLYFSIEKQVTDQTPPTFMWQTVTDDVVPVRNSMLMADALERAGISFEYHLFSKGGHGLSLSNDLWETGDLGEPYTMEQTYHVLNAIKSGALPMQEEVKKQILESLAMMDPDNYTPDTPRPASGVAVKEVAVWPELAVNWMKTLL